MNQIRQEADELQVMAEREIEAKARLEGAENHLSSGRITRNDFIEIYEAWLEAHGAKLRAECRLAGAHRCGGVQ